MTAVFVLSIRVGPKAGTELAMTTNMPCMSRPALMIEHRNPQKVAISALADDACTAIIRQENSNARAISAATRGTLENVRKTENPCRSGQVSGPCPVSYT